jgi:hypothetical protein
MLEKEFDGLQFLDLEGYNVRYPGSGRRFSLLMLRQLPHFLRIIRKEKAWLAHMMKIHHFSAIISDNRYGLYHNKAKSVFITHQLSVISGAGIWVDTILRKIHYAFINRFNTVWIPDAASKPFLSGKLGHPVPLPPQSCYLGPISRMIPMDTQEALDLMIILSGPEHQRTLLENIILAELRHFSGSYLLVRGLPEGNTQLPLEGHYHPQPAGSSMTDSPNTGSSITGPPFKKAAIVNYLDAEALNRKICSASLVICRSGYTSIMDLVKLKKKAILIPTPGQTEQEYLATYFEKQQIFLSARQDGFNLMKMMDHVKTFPFSFPSPDFSEYERVLSAFMQSLP